MSHKIMSHLVAFYPSEHNCLQLAKTLIENGSSYLEVQFPFSDPSADGVAIQTACQTALNSGFTVEGGFRLIEKIRVFSDIPIFLMSYANLVYSMGVKTFCKTASKYKVDGIIVPDLPFDYDEGLFDEAKKCGIDAVPVVFPTICQKRLKRVKNLPSEYIYTALRSGITGEFTLINQENVKYLKRLGLLSKKILAGFGISKKEQVQAITPYVEACVVGSCYINLLEEGFDLGLEKVGEKVKELVGEAR